MIPFLVELSSLLIAIVLGAASVLLVFPTSYLLLRLRGRSRPFQKSIGITAAAFVAIACVSTVAITSLAFAGPPGPWLRPGREAVVGEWRLTEAMVQYLDSRAYSHPPPAELVFLEDGSFSMHDVAYLWGPEFTPALSGGGRWIIDRGVQGEWVVELEFDWIDQGDPSFSSELIFEGRRQPFNLYVWKGEYTMLVFERR